jgi:hypothetical protein
MAASADLSTAVLTAWSAGGFASAAMWDTFTFTGLPTGGEMIGATLSLSGTLSGDATGSALIQAGPSATIGEAGTVDQSAFFGNGAPIPPSISVELLATDTSSVTVVSMILADGLPGNIADLMDPPILSIDLPAGVTAMSASGVFTNFQPFTSVPEPGSATLLLAAFGVLACTRARGAGKILEAPRAV